VQFTAPYGEEHIANRQLGTVQQIDAEGNLQVRLDSGQDVQFNIRDHPHIDYGYAVTSHSSQRATADRVLVHVDTEQAHDQLVNSRLAYGSVSRLRYDAQIYCNAAEKLGEELTRAVSKSGALEAEHETNGRERDHSAECGARNGSWNHFYSSNRPTTTPKSQGFTLRQPALIKFGRNYFPYFVG
jgi:hypothetical protein